MPKIWNIAKTLFVFCLMFLPFAEWRIFYLPLHGRIFGVDLVGYRSASLFDLIFFLFMISLLPFIWQFIKNKTFMNGYMIFWALAILLIPVLYIYLGPTLPYLTPSQINVIGVRGFIVHFSVTVGVTIFLLKIGIEGIIKGSYIFYCAMMLGFVILSALAFTEVPFFSEHYPFALPFTISFPFPSQNVAAPFITICMLGLMGVTSTYRKPMVFILGLPVAVLAAVLTGSRSNIAMFFSAVSVYCLVYFIFHFRGCRPEDRKRNVGIAVALILVFTAIGIVMYNLSWQPVRRAMSVFEAIVKDPLSVVYGGSSGGPRRELWHAALSGEKIEEYEEAEQYRHKVYLISIENGQIRKSMAIKGLNLNQTYYIRLKIGQEEGGSRNGILEVFSDKDRRRLQGETGLRLNKTIPEDLFLFVSDTGTSMGWVTISGSLDNYKVRGPSGEKHFTFSKDEELEWYEEWYREKYGDSRGVIRSNQGKLSLIANMEHVRAYVQKRDILGMSDSWNTLEYEVTINKLRPNQPLRGPARFYVGFHEGWPKDEDWQWQILRNGILIGHERILTPFDEHVTRQMRLQRLKFNSKRKHHSINFDKNVDTSQGKRHEIEPMNGVRIENLWDPTIAIDKYAKKLREEESKAAETFQTGSRVKDIKLIFAKAKSQSTAMWTVESHLAQRGSTHNVYLDWYYYVGKLPFTLFVSFIFMLITAFAVFLYKQKGSPYFWFYLSTWLQLIVLSGAMYSHPGIWIKYIWFIFGIAGALMLLGDDSILNKETN